MKPPYPLVGFVCLFALCKGAFAQGITTLICQGNQTNQVQITSLQSAKVKSYWDYEAATLDGGPSFVRIQSGTNVIDLKARSLTPSGNGGAYTPGFTISGPATISLITQGSPSKGILTLDIEPAPFPPGKAVTVGAYSGNVQVTMEMSTDLVNWTPAVNAMVYTNSPDARFFRIKLVTNASP